MSFVDTTATTTSGASLANPDLKSEDASRLEETLCPRFWSMLIHDFQVDVVLEGTHATLANILDHMRQPRVEIDNSFVIEQFASFVRRTDSIRDFLGATGKENRIEIEPQLIGDARREIDDGDDFLIGPDVDNFADNIRPKCHFLQTIETVINE